MINNYHARTSHFRDPENFNGNELRTYFRF